MQSAGGTATNLFQQLLLMQTAGGTATNLFLILQRRSGIEDLFSLGFVGFIDVAQGHLAV